MLVQILLIAVLRDRDYYSHFADDRVEAGVSPRINFILADLSALFSFPKCLFSPTVDVFLPAVMEDDQWPMETSTLTAHGPTESGTLYIKASDFSIDFTRGGSEWASSKDIFKIQQKSN